MPSLQLRPERAVRASLPALLLLVASVPPARARGGISGTDINWHLIVNSNMVRLWVAPNEILGLLYSV